MQEYLERSLDGGRLLPVELDKLFAAMMHGQCNEHQMTAFLAVWRVIGESENELFAGAKVLREHAIKPKLSRPSGLLADNCGTGGDGAHTFNISTAAAIVASSGGVKMAKHGNRSVSSKCGSADLLFAAGFPDNLSPEGASLLLEQTGFTFFFAPQFHPMMKNVMPVRRSLSVRTIFNLLGPLANPLAPDIQLIGVSHKKYLHEVAKTLFRLGCQKGLVVHSRDGLDEISPCAISDGVIFSEKGLQDWQFDPESFGVHASLSQLKGGDKDENLSILGDFLDGKRDAIYDAVCLNAGCLIWLCGQADSLLSGFDQAKELVTSGRVKHFFTHWIKEAKELV
jgi:anthranilate phosphoribosyltransferase